MTSELIERVAQAICVEDAGQYAEELLTKQHYMDSCRRIAQSAIAAMQADAAPVSDKLRPAVEVWRYASDAATLGSVKYKPAADEAAAAIIEQDREAVRAEQAAELAKWRDRYNKLGQLALGHISDLSTDLNRNEAELAKYKALVEALVGKIELFRSMLIDNDFDFGEAVEEFLSAVEPALREYKEARDAS